MADLDFKIEQGSITTNTNSEASVVLGCFYTSMPSVCLTPLSDGTPGNDQNANVYVKSLTGVSGVWTLVVGSSSPYINVAYRIIGVM